MDNLIAYAMSHPLILAMLYSVLSIVSLDIDEYIKFRTEHPGASFDHVVAALRLFKGMIAPVLVSLGAMGYQAATQ